MRRARWDLLTVDRATSFRNELRRILPGRSERDQKYLFLGILTKHLAGVSRPILVGGSLVEFYTMGAIASADLDLVGERNDVKALLATAGFKERGRYFESLEFPLLVEVPGHSLRDTESVEPLRFEEYMFYAVSVEDAIVDRLLAAKFWQSRSDWERALLLVRAQAANIKWDILDDRARRNDVADVAAEARRIAAG